MTIPLRWASVGAAVLASLLAWQWAGAEETVTVALPPGVMIPEAAQPGPVEKLLFYDHPSGRDRVELSMQWLRENQSLVERKP